MCYYSFLGAHFCKFPSVRCLGNSQSNADDDDDSRRYVAMQTMQEEDSQNMAQDELPTNGYLDGPSGRQNKGQKESRNPRLVLAAVGGMLLPLLTQIGHAH